MLSSTRRSFFGATAAAFAASRSGLGATGSQPGDIKLGVASYSFREFQRHLAIESTKKLNVAYINIKDVHLPLNSTPDEIAKARKEFEKAGLTIVGGGNISFQKDDEADMRYYLQKILPLLGHEVVAVAENGRQLVEQCRASHPDLVITDIKMPELDGISRVRPILTMGRG